MVVRWNKWAATIGLHALLAMAATALAQAGDVTWTITSGTANFGGYQRSGQGAPYFQWVSQGAGATSTTVLGDFTTTNTFTSVLDFGTEPDYPRNPRATDVDEMGNPKYPAGIFDPQLLADFEYWLSVTMEPYLVAENRVTLANSGTYAPGPLPWALALIQGAALPPIGAAPAAFGAKGFDGFGIDPMNPVQKDMSLSKFRVGFYTNKTDPPNVNTNPPYSPENPQYNLEDPLMFPTGAPVNLTQGADYGKFASGVASFLEYFEMNFYSTDYMFNGLAGTWPQVGANANQAATQSRITRNGAEYVMTLYAHDIFDQLGDIRSPPETDFGDFVFDIDMTITAVANILPGDANFDGTVDIFDVNMISSNWSGGMVVGNLTPGDVNGDGTVDIFDVNLVSTNWGATGGGGASLAGAASVPEPTAVVLAAVGAVGLWCAARRCRRLSR